ncbi:S-layer family protein [Roseofilum sp. BLCC_M91]|uniref:S-layer family protein n=1 Tax=Roseofilum halophilum BLCC-M91 TaxID=3022259 RepID=A0ABT7BSQ2_9CYAN|nr:S-layer family protein [Roseofilum halophilum]MDJ1181328.1 S-layer family protein [Roseofilum halophilum BLCC-M91]
MSHPWKTLLSLPLVLSVFPTLASAQIIPDQTLPNPTLVTPGNNQFTINGGTQVGGNLFHSFSQFSLPTNNTASFNNSLNIENIITRITGGSLSNIDGLIEANGSANLFLLNPNGIVFGPNATLNIGGSFLATTANSFTFANGTEFSATNPQTTPLLTVNVPIGLKFGATPGGIVVQGTGHDIVLEPDGAVIRQSTPGLRVSPGQTLTLAGGTITFRGGNVGADEGHVVLGSVGPHTEVGLTPSLDLEYDNPFNFQDIQLSELSSVDVSGEGAGDISIQGRHITLTGGSLILGITEGENPGGTIVVNASESIHLFGFSEDEMIPTAIISETINTGSSGDIVLNTHRLIIQEGAQASTSTFAPGEAGQLTVNASGWVELSGTDFSGFPSGLFSGTLGLGRGGSVVVNTNRLIVQDGAVISSSVIPSPFEDADAPGGNIRIDVRELTVQREAQISSDTFGLGNAGTLNIRATDGIRLNGGSPEVPSGIFSQADFILLEDDAIAPTGGNAGTIRIETPWLSIEDGAIISSATFAEGQGGLVEIQAPGGIQIAGSTPDREFVSSIAASTLGPGRAGDVTIATGTLLLRDGGLLTAGAGDTATGDGGTLRVTASESVTLSGVASETLPTRLTVRTEGPGNAGDLILATERLTVENGAQINLDGIGRDENRNLIIDQTVGDAGNILITAPQVQLNGGQITANTTSGTQGNIFLNSQDIRLRQGSQIVTNAFGESTGGNITINTDLLTALENSDISANAEQNFGGRVIITAQGIYGTEFRNQLTPESDITATSALGPQFSGVVEINTPDIDPAQNTADLPQAIETPEGIRPICRPEAQLRSGERELTVEGRGLPPNPTQPVNPGSVEVEMMQPVPASRENGQPLSAVESHLTPSRPRLPIATGWVMNEKGEIFLTTTSEKVTPHRSLQPNPDCVRE